MDYHRPLIQREAGLLLMELQQSSLGGKGWGLQNIPDSLFYHSAMLIRGESIAFTVSNKTVELLEGIVGEYDC